MRLDARYFDGSSLEATEVSAHFDLTSMSVRAVDGALIDAYPITDVVLLYADQLGNRVDLGVRGQKDLRLMLETPGVRQALVSYLPQLATAPRGENMQAGFKITGFLVGVIALVGLAIWQLERIVPSLIPESTARSLGTNLANQYVDMLGGRCEDPAGEAAVERMVARLMSGADKKMNLRVQVANHDLVNAFALPGGQIVIFDGLIQAAASADEVAGVLAHEIGHEQHKHSLRGMTRSIGIDILGAVFGGGNVTEFSKQMLALSHSRGMEEEADEAALALLEKAEVSAKPLAGFFERLSADEQESLGADIGEFLSFLSTHPDSAARAEAMRRAPEGYTSPVLADADWQAMRQMCGTDEEKEAKASSGEVG